jgi:hypothetical protein
MATTPSPALVLRDLRSNSEPMRPLTVKLPARMIDAIERYAAEHSAPRSTVVRNLLAHGVEALVAPAAADTKTPQAVAPARGDQIND